MKLTFDEALQRLADEFPVERDEVQARALARKVWIAEWHFAGCLSEARGVYTRKEDAIEGALWYMDTDEEEPIPRGALTALRKHGAFGIDTRIYTVEQCTLGELLS